MTPLPTDSSRSDTPSFNGPSGSGTADQSYDPSASASEVQGTLGELSRSAVLQQVCAVQRTDWEEGNRILVEQYLQQNPILQDDGEVILDLIYNEIILREEQGERPHMAEYVQRFPQYGTELQKQFSVHRALSPSSAEQTLPPLSQVPSGTAEGSSNATPSLASGAPPVSGDTPALGSHTPAVGADGVPLTLSMQPVPQSPSQMPTQGQMVDVSPSKIATLAQPVAVPTKKGKKILRPDNIPGYDILGTLGRGGMGVVYRARQTRLKREVALKMVLAGAHASPEQIDRFRQEAELLAKLQHPNIVQVYEVGEDQGQPFFSLEFVSGGALDKKIAGTPQPFRWAAEMTETLACGMHAAHQAGVIHRDLKPANVLLTTDGTPKITDFGLAKQLEDESGQTHTGQVMGTPSYMAPEQASGRIKDMGAHTDVYALGAILYELLTGRPPFKGETPWETVRLVIADDPLPPSRLRPKLPRDLETICLKALQKPIAKRYATGEELAKDLRRYLNGEPIEARRTPPWEKAWKFARRKPWVAGGLVAAVLVLVLSGLVAAQEYRQALKENAEILKTGKMRTEVGTLIGQAKAAIEEHQDYPRGVTLLDQAEKRKGDEEIPPELQSQINELRAQAARGNDYRTRLDSFRQFRDQALLHATGVTAHERAYNIRVMKEASQKALELFGATVGTSTAVDAPAGYFADSERAEINEGCYEVLLVQATAAAEPSPMATHDEWLQQLEGVLLYFDRADSLGIKTRIGAIRRADYLRQLRRDAEAAEVRKAMPKESAGAIDHYLQGIDDFNKVKSMTQTDLLHQAMEHFSRALEIQPKHFWSHYYLGLCHLRIHDYAAAETHFDLCRGFNPQLTWLYIGLGLARTELANKLATVAPRDPLRAKQYFDAAEVNYTQALSRNPDEETRYAILNNRGLLRFRSLVVNSATPENFNKAVRDLHDAIKLRPRQIQSYTVLGEFYLQGGQLDQAIAQLDKALEISPSYLEGYRTRHRAHLQKQDYAGALQDIEQAINHHPSGAKGPDLAEDYVQQGELLRRSRKMTEAVAAFNTALEREPAYPKAYRSRAMALFEQAELSRTEPKTQRRCYEGAINSLDEYLQTEKPEANLYLIRGLAKAKLANVLDDPAETPAGQPPTDRTPYILGAVDDYSRALELPFQKNADTPIQLEFQNHPAAATRVQRGTLYLLILDAPKLAERDFVEAIRLNPKIGPEAYVGRGLCLIQARGRFKDAVADAEQALEEARQRHAENAFVLYNAARIYAFSVGRLDLEINARKSDPKYDVRPLGNLRPGYVKEALKNLQQALEKLATPQQRKSFWDRTVLTDRAFTALRNEPAFRQLFETFAK